MKTRILFLLCLFRICISTAQQTYTQWSHSIGGYSYDDSGQCIKVDGSGNVYTTGYFQGTLDFDPGTATTSLASAGQGDIFISKVDATENLVWAKRIGGTSSDYGNSLAVDASGNVFVAGLFSGTVDFDPGTGTANLTSSGSYDIFICKLDVSGNFVWAKRMGSSSVDAANSIVLDATGNAYIAGSFLGTVDFDPGVGTANLTSTSNTEDILCLQARRLRKLCLGKKFGRHIS